MNYPLKWVVSVPWRGILFDIRSFLLIQMGVWCVNCPLGVDRLLTLAGSVEGLGAVLASEARAAIKKNWRGLEPARIRTADLPLYTTHKSST